MSYFATPRRVSLEAVRLRADVEFAPDLVEPLRRAFACVNALHTFGVPEVPTFLAGPVDATLATLVETLQAASNAVGLEKDLVRHLQLRAEAVLAGTFEEARRFGASIANPSIELTIGPIPSWRHPAHPLRYSASLSAPVRTSADFEKVDLITERIAEHLYRDARTPALPRSFSPPLYAVTDLALTAGEAADFPHHFASFLPEDEGLLGETTKTVVFRNFYLARFQRVSEPLLRSLVDQPASHEAGSAEDVLLTWLRAHDLAHSYFDPMCVRAGLNPTALHATRELLADLVGFAATAELLDYDLAVEAVLVAECLRYAGRDETLFADALAARCELGWLTRGGRPVVVGDSMAFAETSSGLAAEVANRLCNSEAARFEAWMTQLASMPPGDSPTRAEDLTPILDLAEHSEMRHRSRRVSTVTRMCAHV